MGDIRIIATVKAVIGSFLGAVIGTGIFLLVRSALAGTALVGPRSLDTGRAGARPRA